jgi:hypothetical protein
MNARNRRFNPMQFNETHVPYMPHEGANASSVSVLADVRSYIERSYQHLGDAYTYGHKYRSTTGMFEHLLYTLTYAAMAHEKFVYHIATHDTTTEVSHLCATLTFRDTCTLSSFAELAIRDLVFYEEINPAILDDYLDDPDVARVDRRFSIRTRLFHNEGRPMINECWHVRSVNKMWDAYVASRAFSLAQFLEWNTESSGPMALFEAARDWIHYRINMEPLPLRSRWIDHMQTIVPDGDKLTERLEDYFTICFLTEAGSAVIHPEFYRAMRLHSLTLVDSAFARWILKQVPAGGYIHPDVMAADQALRLQVSRPAQPRDHAEPRDANQPAGPADETALAADQTRRKANHTILPPPTPAVQ